MANQFPNFECHLDYECFHKSLSECFKMAVLLLLFSAIFIRTETKVKSI